MDVDVEHHMSHDITIEVRDKEIVGSEPIGAVLAGLSFFVREGGVFNDWVELYFRGQSAGKIHLKCEYHAN
jgi:hypothetical protein